MVADSENDSQEFICRTLAEANLTPDEQVVVYLQIVRGLTPQQTAEEMGRPMEQMLLIDSTARAKVQTARSILRRLT